jgi:hypothetical protein
MPFVQGKIVMLEVMTSRAEGHPCGECHGLLFDLDGCAGESETSGAAPCGRLAFLNVAARLVRDTVDA